MPASDNPQDGRVRPAAWNLAIRDEFEGFYLRTSRKLHGYLCRLGKDPSLADEVLQDAYIRMIHVPVMEEARLRSYLYKTATNLLRDRWRKSNREEPWDEDVDIQDDRRQNIDLQLDMAGVLEKLNPQERAMLWLAHVEELSHQEIGAILNVKEKSVRVLLFRAREKAKHLLMQVGLGVANG